MFNFFKNRKQKKYEVFNKMINENMRGKIQLYDIKYKQRVVITQTVQEIGDIRTSIYYVENLHSIGIKSKNTGSYKISILEAYHRFKPIIRC